MQDPPYPIEKSKFWDKMTEIGYGIKGPWMQENGGGKRFNPKKQLGQDLRGPIRRKGLPISKKF